MTVSSVDSSVDDLTMTIVADFDAEVERVWQVWEDPRQLERWWGPPTWPATFEQHSMEVGGTSAYYMTGPDGEKARGWWRTVAVDAPHRFEFEDGFADDAGAPMDEMGITRAVVTLERVGSGTRMTTTSTFESAEQMQQMLDMGMKDGMTLAMGQIDALLAPVEA